MFNEAGQPLHTVLYRKGKGGGGAAAPAPPPPTYTDPQTGMTFTDPNALNAEIAQNQTTAANNAAAAQAAAQAQATANENTFQGNRQQAYNDALQSVMQTFQGQGVDPTNYMGYITPQLQSAYNSIPDLAANPSSYFPTSLGQQIMNEATGDRRTNLMNTLNATFTPTYSSSMIPTNTMDQSVQSILSNQFDPLAAQLTNAMNRGTLNPIGYQAALDKMNQDKASAQSQLQTLGQNIITGDRSDLDTLAGNARSDIANMTLGQNIDPSQYFTQGAQKAASDISGFPGALQSASGNVTFADITDLLNAGGSVQGATNPTAANPMAGGAQGTGAIGGGGGVPGTGQIPGDINPAPSRGLGSTGAF